MANKEINELTSASTLDGTELVHVVKGGNSRKTTTAQISNLLLIDEDDFSSDSAAKSPSQQSTKAYIDAAIPAKLNASGGAPIFACRAWVNFNGTGTVAIRSSGNVSSITDNGTGNYTINFTTAMPDANYAVAASANAATYAAQSSAVPDYSSFSTSSLIIKSGNTISGAVADMSHVTCAVFR